MKKIFVILIALAGMSVFGCEDLITGDKNSFEDTRVRITSARLTDGVTDVVALSPVKKSNSSLRAPSDGVYAEYVTWETWSYGPNRDTEYSWDEQINSTNQSETAKWTYKQYDDITPVTGTTVTNATIKGLADTLFLREIVSVDVTKTLRDGTEIFIPKGTEIYNGYPSFNLMIDGVNTEIHSLAIRATVHFTDGSTTKYVKLLEMHNSEIGDLLNAYVWLPVHSSYVEDMSLIMTIEIDASIVRPL